MSTNTKTTGIRLSDMDRKIIGMNKDICTESHGRGCSSGKQNEKDGRPD
jgi:hypothetical protein